MPARKRFSQLDGKTKVKKSWVLYSTNRTFCFLDEIQLGYFGVNYRCGCKNCDPQLVLPEPPFTPPPDQGAAAQKGS